MGTKFEGIISHIKRASEVSFLLRSDLIILVVFLFFFIGCICTECLTTERHPGSPAGEDQYLNYAVVGSACTGV